MHTKKLSVLALLVLITWAAIGAMGEQRDEAPVDRESLRDQIHRAKDDLSKAERLLEEGPGITDRLKSMARGLFGGGGEASAAGDTGAGEVSTVGSDLFHRIKKSVGMGDESTWEKIKSAFEPHEPTLIDKLKSAVGIAPKSFPENILERVKHSLSGETSSTTDDFLHRLKVALGAERPTVGERISGAWHGATEKAAEMAPASLRQATDITGDKFNQLLHSLKVAVGAESPTAWEKIKSALGIESYGVTDQIRSKFTTSDSVWERVKHAVQGESNSEAILRKAKEAFTNAMQSVVPMAAQGADIATEKVKDLAGGSSYDELMHRLKVAIGTEDETLWEKVKNAVQPREGILDKIKHTVTGREPSTAESIFERIKGALPGGESRTEKVLHKAKVALGIESPTIGERVSGMFSGHPAEPLAAAADKGKETLEKATGDSYDELMHRLKVAIGTEDESLWEKVKNAVQPREGILDKIKHTVTGREPSTAESIFERIKRALPGGESRTEKVLHKAKVALGIESPTIGERVSGMFSGHPAEPLAAAADKGKEAMEQLTGESYENVLHQIKSSIGVDNPTVYEKLQSLWQPRRGIVDKIRHALGRDKPVTRESLYEQITSLLGGDQSETFEPVLKRIRGVLGLEHPSFLERAKEGVAGLFRRKEKSPLEKAMDALRDSTESNRGGAMRSLQMALDETKRDMEEKARKLVDDVSRAPDKASKGYDEFKSLLGGFYSSMQRLTQQFDRDRPADWEHKDAFLQASNYDDKTAMHYINENGREFLDITGPFSDKYTEKLRVLNEFRKDFGLPEHNNIPDSVSLQLHPIHQKHVICKAKRIIDGNVVEYTYDDGHETIGIDWKDESAATTISPELSVRMASWFREDLGLPTPEHSKKAATGILPKIRTTVQALKSEL